METRLNALDQIPSPSQSVLSPATGKIVVLEADSGRSLFEQVVDEILRKPIRWDVSQQTIIDLSNDAAPKVAPRVLGFGTSHVTKTLSAVLGSATSRPVEVEDVSVWGSDKVDSDQSDARPAPHKIAIVGMSGRFPGAPDVEALWRLLEQGRDMHREVPKDRFDVETHYDLTGKKSNTSHTPYGCFIEEPGLFDPRFFNMSPQEASQTDPMHRLALVTAYEALEMSGFVLNSTPSTQADRVGTFYGQTSDDWREVNAAQTIKTYFIPGGVRAFAPGRISYYFGFRGPSYSVDTACSSSLAAIQVACTSLRSGECDTAVAGGLNVLTAPDIFAGLSRGQFLSKTGSCKTWDTEADGYCRADGVGSIVMKRLEDALADKDKILGVVLATATNHSADAISITHPHAGNQAYLYESVLHSVGVDPLEVSYVEMHGTGTQAGDLAETRSVTDVFAPERGRTKDHPLYVGAVKSNVGHSEAAAGVTALIKVLLMLQKNAIPPHIGIKNQLNPALPNFERRNVRIPFKQTPWASVEGKPRLAFLNNFSAAGGNTAMLLQEAPQPQLTTGTDPRPTLPFVISAKSLSSLQRSIQRLISYLEKTSKTSLGSLSYTLTARRMYHSYRVGVAASDLDGLKIALLARLNGGSFAPVPSKAPPVAFVFSGQGAFYTSLGRQVFELSSDFRSEIKHLNHVAITQGLPSFLLAIDGSVDEEHQLSPLVIQLAMVCVQMALVRLWKSWGISPSVVIGHSLGEYAALNAAGVLSPEDTIYVVGRRAQLLEEKCTEGTHAMLAVKASIAEIEAATRGLSFEIACFNSAGDTVLASSVDQVESLSQVLKRAGYKCIILKLPYAFHSAQLEPILDDFEELATAAIFNKPTIPVISPLLSQVIDTEDVFNSHYLRRHAREPVNFVDAVQEAAGSGFLDAKTIFIEIGPYPICSTMIKACLGTDISAVPSLHKAEGAWKTLSQSLCSLHCAGLPIDWHHFHRDYESSHELLSLPAYSFDDKNYWIDYVNDWCLYKIEPRTLKLIEEAKPAVPVSKLSTTSSVHRVVFEELKSDQGTVVAQSDLSDPVLRAVVLGHLVNDAGLCPSVSSRSVLQLSIVEISNSFLVFICRYRLHFS